MLPPLLVDLWSGNPDWQVFALASLVTGFVGGALVLMRGLCPTARLETRQAFLLTSLVWLATTAFASLPFLFSELGLTPADAFFEAMSGITTTGSTVITGLDDAPPGILLWRSTLQWLGGGRDHRHGGGDPAVLERRRDAAFSNREFRAHRKSAAACGTDRLGYGRRLLEPHRSMRPCLLACRDAPLRGGDPCDDDAGDRRLCHPPTPRSQASAVPASSGIAILFMGLGGVPLMLIVQALRGRPDLLWRDVQVRWYLTLILLVALLLFAWVHLTGQATGHAGIRHVLFSTVAVVTGTGYASVDYNGWGTFPIVVFFFLTCVGGCTGSTTGGIKVFPLRHPLRGEPGPSAAPDPAEWRLPPRLQRAADFGRGSHLGHGLRPSSLPSSSAS